MEVYEIYTDASIRTFENGRTFGCSGAICPKMNMETFMINPDTTNNKSELTGIYLGVVLAHHILVSNPDSKIKIYSDSQFGVFGLTKWIHGWTRNVDENFIMYGSNNMPVKNQDYFKCILNYAADNGVRVNLLHQSGHVRFSSQKMLRKANDVFRKSNGTFLNPEDIYKISYYNDLVDKSTRNKLDNINPDDYPEIPHSPDEACQINYKLNPDYWKYVTGGVRD